MYIPRHNAENDLPTLRKLVRDHPLCALVTQTTSGMVASHIPMVLHEQDEGFGTLRGHVARANTQWRDHIADAEALGIFTGPDHYISASWYPGKLEHGREVPTWNYVAVHVYGELRVIEDPAWLLDHLRSLTDTHEAASKAPWRVDDAPPEFIANMMRGIVGVELAVTRVEGKWKVSQNRDERDAAAVVAGLDELGTSESATMSRLVMERCRK
ncbi:FMN-binding negative transcriptional regulator [Silvibacterium acidisoli]|uniref:FMN-binding negative transcriptional regulator n=1 Tax=Acidobacteriaceae bacterium ZG23-2 TaxID=2883246 RepID=UPI00406CBD73